MGDKGEPRKEDYPILRPCTTEHINADGCIYKGNCLVTGWTISSDSGNRWCKIYDGENAKGKLIWELYIGDESTMPKNMVYPVDFDRGIYVDVENDHVHLSIEYIPESWGKFH